MYLTYGYDLKENDDLMILPARRTGEIMSKLVLPGAALVNYLPFREVPLSPTQTILIGLSHGYIQSNASLPGSLGLSMSLWQVSVKSWD